MNSSGYLFAMIYYIFPCYFIRLLLLTMKRTVEMNNLQSAVKSFSRLRLETIVLQRVEKCNCYGLFLCHPGDHIFGNVNHSYF